MLGFIPLMSMQQTKSPAWKAIPYWGIELFSVKARDAPYRFFPGFFIKKALAKRLY
jgi:hypothetical protein